MSKLPERLKKAIDLSIEYVPKITKGKAKVTFSNNIVDIEAETKKALHDAQKNIDLNMKNAKANDRDDVERPAFIRWGTEKHFSNGIHMVSGGVYLKVYKASTTTRDGERIFARDYDRFHAFPLSFKFE